MNTRPSGISRSNCLIPAAPIHSQSHSQQPNSQQLEHSWEPPTQSGQEPVLSPTDYIPSERKSENHAVRSLPDLAAAASTPLDDSTERFLNPRRTMTTRPGAEPGIDPSNESSEYDQISMSCRIEVIDYGSDVTFREFDNQGFLEYLQSSESTRESKFKVRWLNIHGIDWSIVKALSLAYNIHPLAIEDIFQASVDSRSKVDYYPNHIFLQCLALMFTPNEIEEGAANHHLGKCQREHAEPTRVENNMEVGRSPYGIPEKHAPRSSTSNKGHLLATPSRRRAAATAATIRKLREKERIRVRERSLYMFLTRDGTLISIHDSLDSVNDAAIKQRLYHPKTLLRSTSDASVLLQSILDLVVDHAIEVVDAYKDELLQLEQATLLKPDMESAKLLHLLSADIMLHKRTLTPLKSLIYGIRRYDLDRCLGLNASLGPDSVDPSEVCGFISHQAKIYLTDVHDHIEYVLSSLDMFQGTTENLIGFSFNVLSYDMNQIMRRLTLATILFLPLTFLTSYYGMNFKEMPSVEGSDNLFWKIAIPCTAALLLMLSWHDVKRFGKYMMAKNISRKIRKTHRVSSK